MTWGDRAAWIVLAAVPSSLLLGVTTHVTMDVVSAPLLWVVPLALYLITFIIAFQDRPLFTREGVLMFQAAALAGCLVILPFAGTDIPPGPLPSFHGVLPHRPHVSSGAWWPAGPIRRT